MRELSGTGTPMIKFELACNVKYIPLTYLHAPFYKFKKVRAIQSPVAKYQGLLCTLGVIGLAFRPEDRILVRSQISIEWIFKNTPHLVQATTDHR